MHMYETTTGIRRKNPGYTGPFAIICLFASLFLAWAVMRTSVVKTSLEMMSWSPATTEMTSRTSVDSAAKRSAARSQTGRKMP